MRRSRLCLSPAVSSTSRGSFLLFVAFFLLLTRFFCSTRIFIKDFLTPCSNSFQNYVAFWLIYLSSIIFNYRRLEGTNLKGLSNSKQLWGPDKTARHVRIPDIFPSKYLLRLVYTRSSNLHKIQINPSVIGYT